MYVRHRFANCSRLAIASTVFAFFLTACGPSSAPAPDPAADEANASDVEPAPVVEPVATSGEDGEAGDGGGTDGGDGSTIVVDALEASDVEAAGLPGELACAFVDDDGAPLLRAAGNVASDDPALGIVKLSGVVEKVRAPGGFDGILDDPTFSVRGMTIRIRFTGAAMGGGESPPRPATMTLLRADGASRGIDGRWECGP